MPIWRLDALGLGRVDGLGRSVSQSKGGRDAILGRLGENGRLFSLFATHFCVRLLGFPKGASHAPHVRAGVPFVG